MVLRVCAFVGMVTFLLGLGLSMGLFGAQAAQTVVYPQPPVAGDARSAYAVKMIRLALDLTRDEFGPATVTYSDFPLERDEAEWALTKGHAHVFALPGRDMYDQRYLHVPIPIDRGMLGIRVGFVSRDNRNLLENVRSLEDMAAYKICTNLAWTITDVFLANQLSIHPERAYAALYQQLNAGTCDYFSRGVGEILSEFGTWSRHYESLAIDPHILMRVPMALYLYVHKDNATLARRIEIGLLRAFEQGSFEKLFDQEYHIALGSLGLFKRQQLILRMPEVHRNAPSVYSPLWYQMPSD